jgi:ParB family chromosome partitioning protein
MRKIRKGDMADVADSASDRVVSIADRLQHSKELLGQHPLREETPEGKSVQSPETSAASVLVAASPAVAAPTPNVFPGVGRAVSGRSFVAVPVDLIDDNPYNARRIYKAERVAELGESIAAHTQQQPGIATIRDGRYVLCAGHYRKRAIKAKGIPTMDLIVHDAMTDRELYEASYRENQERETQTPMDNALAWQVLLEKQVYANETAIAEATGMSLSTVNRTLSLLKLSAPVLELVRGDPSSFSFSGLYELLQYEQAGGEPASAQRFAMQLGNGEIGRLEISEARKAIEAPKHRKLRNTARSDLKITAEEGEQIGKLKEWDDGRVLLEVTLADPRERNALMDELKTRFKIS